MKNNLDSVEVEVKSKIYLSKAVKKVALFLVYSRDTSQAGVHQSESVWLGGQLQPDTRNPATTAPIGPHKLTSEHLRCFSNDPM